MRKDVLTHIYNNHASIIYKYLLKHGCRSEVAEEIVHDSFVKAIEHFDDLEPQRLSSWIFKVALNHYRNYLKKASTREELIIEENRFSERLSADGDIVKSLLSEEATNDIRNTLNCLKKSYKELLIMKYELELSYKEIASILGLPEKNIKTYLFRARKEFKRVWRDNNG